MLYRIYRGASGAAILYGTLVAVSVKFALSPHSPVTSYIAVGFQGIVGALMFSFQRRSLPVYIFYGGIALAESALQKVITLTVIYGNALWDSLNVAAQQIAKSLHMDSSLSYAVILLCIYSMVYFVWGCLIGYWAHKIPHEINNIDKFQIINIDTSGKLFNKKKKEDTLPGVVAYGIDFVCFGNSYAAFRLKRIAAYLTSPYRSHGMVVCYQSLTQGDIGSLFKWTQQQYGAHHRQHQAGYSQVEKTFFTDCRLCDPPLPRVSRVRRFITILIILASEEKSNLTG